MNEEYREYKCPVCGKVFNTTMSGWGWLIGSESSPKPVCSYKCQRKWEKTPKKERKTSRPKVPVRIVETGEIFRSISDCAAGLNASISSLHDCIYKGKSYKGLHIERVIE